jgi:predicted Zn-dependent peptidase
MQIDNIEKRQLNNGVRILTEQVPGVRSVSMGIWVGAGSRRESEERAGISHFIEHMMFKGTERRSATEIAEALDSVGGQLNAFTTKEYTCYYTKTLDEHFDLALDVLTDMFFNSTFAPQAIEKERNVIEEEIKMYEDTPDELIHDLFVHTAWPEHPLGRPILGTAESLSRFQQSDFLAYLKEKYVANQIVIAIAGNLQHEEIQDKVARVFEKVPAYHEEIEMAPPEQTKVNVTNLTRDTGQVQICLGTGGLSQHDERLYTASILNNVLGGGLSSRLVQSIREERGLAYSVFSYHTAFCDTGLFTLYAGTGATKYSEVINLLIRGIDQILANGITVKELERAKEQIKGSLLLGLESVSSRMTRLGRNELCLKRIIPLSEIVERITAVTLDDVKALADELFSDKRYTLSTIGPIKEPINLQSFLA